MTEHTAPVATVIDDNQPGRTAIIEVMTDPPTLPVGTKLYAEPQELKRSEIFSFDDGLLTIKVSGHGRANGWGSLAFHERQVEIDADGFHTVEIPPSELRELRDFIDRVLKLRHADAPAPRS